MAKIGGAFSVRGASIASSLQNRPMRSIVALGIHAFWVTTGLALTLVVWTLLSHWLGPTRLPSPMSLWPSFVTDLFKNKVLEFQGGGSRGILPHLLYTIEKTLLGSLIGCVIGLTVGLAGARWKSLGVFLDIPLGALRSIPPLAAIPFMVLWFGPSQAAQLGVVIFYAALMIAVTTSTAVANLDPIIQQFAQTLGARQGHVFRTVIMPSIVPELVGGLRVLVGIAWGIEVVSELAGAQQGMGQVFSRMVTFHKLDVIIEGIIWITLVAAVTDALIVLISRIFTRWAPQNVNQ